MPRLSFVRSFFLLAGFMLAGLGLAHGAGRLGLAPGDVPSISATLPHQSGGRSPGPPDRPANPENPGNDTPGNPDPGPPDDRGRPSNPPGQDDDPPGNGNPDPGRPEDPGQNPDRPGPDDDAPEDENPGNDDPGNGNPGNGGGNGGSDDDRPGNAPPDAGPPDDTPPGNPGQPPGPPAEPPAPDHPPDEDDDEETAPPGNGPPSTPGNPTPAGPQEPPQRDEDEDPVSEPPGEERAAHYYVATVSVNDGSSVFAGGVKLESNSPWLEVLRPGMWFEAYGRWSDDAFVAEHINALPGKVWSYYRGPAALLGRTSTTGSVEVWTSDDEGLGTVRSSASTNGDVRVVAYFDGNRLLALPANLPPAPPGLSVGWIELLGSYDGNNLVWTSATSFP